MTRSTCLSVGCATRRQATARGTNNDARTIRSSAMPSVAQLIKALPENEEIEVARGAAPPAARPAQSLRPVPLGRLRRTGLLGTLQAKIAAAYLFYWVRGWL